MSIRHLSYVACDGCGNPCDGMDGCRENAQVARAHARGVGWRFFSQPYDGAVDLCPSCMENPPIYWVRQRVELERQRRIAAGLLA